MTLRCDCVSSLSGVPRGPWPGAGTGRIPKLCRKTPITVSQNTTYILENLTFNALTCVTLT